MTGKRIVEVPAEDGQALEVRWGALVPLRDDAIRAVRAKITRPEDAEEHVQEAMLRLVQHSALVLEPRQLRSLLIRAAVCLAIDRHRSAVRHSRLLPRLFFGAGATTPEELVADRSEAKWLAGGLATLGLMEREALALAVDGRRPGEIAALLGVDYKAAENALGRARRKLRLMATAAAMGLACLLRRLRSGVEQPVLVTATSAVAAVLLLQSGPAGQVAPWRQPAAAERPPVMLSSVPVAAVLPPPVAAPTVVTTASPAAQAAAPPRLPGAPVAMDAAPHAPVTPAPSSSPVTVPPAPWKDSPPCVTAGRGVNPCPQGGTPQAYAYECVQQMRPTIGFVLQGDVRVCPVYPQGPPSAPAAPAATSAPTSATAPAPAPQLH